MKSLQHFLWLMALPGALAAAAAAPAAEVERQGARLIVSGPLDTDSAKALSEQLGQGGVRTVIFEDSTGGSAEAGEAYAMAIRAAGVFTEAKGRCQAACVLAFLAGKEHRFARGLQVNSLLVPLGTRVRSGGDEVRRTLAEFTVGTTVREAWLPMQGLLFTATPTLFGRVYATFWCDGTQGRDTSRCEVVGDADPYKLGVLTP